MAITEHEAHRGPSTGARILIMNSDSPVNRGDRAILAGLVAVVRDLVPDARITALSQFAERDGEWFGVRFLPFSPYAVAPRAFAALVREARRSDVVLWGGGELLKDYTNRAGLAYWALKIGVLSIAAPPIVGAFQGIGPTSAPSSRWLIARTVDRTRRFLVRDAESVEKLRSWGVRVPIVGSFDPAVYAVTAPADDDALRRTEVAYGVRAGFLDNFVGFGVRRWFHYRPAGFLPARMRPVGKPDPDRQRVTSTYLDRLAALADRVVEDGATNAVFFPMHVAESEGDPAFAAAVVARMRHPDRALVIDRDDLSPSAYHALLARSRSFLASRLHAAILATVAGVPTVCLYYVDKGRQYFEQLGLAHRAFPIESVLEDEAVERLSAALVAAEGADDRVRAAIDERLVAMRSAVRRDLADALEQVVAGIGRCR